MLYDRFYLQALSKFTSKLPLLDVEPIKEVIGHNTEEAILSGVVRGHACMIEGLLKECEKDKRVKGINLSIYRAIIKITEAFCEKYKFLGDEHKESIFGFGRYIFKQNSSFTKILICTQISF